MATSQVRQLASCERVPSHERHRLRFDAVKAAALGPCGEASPNGAARTRLDPKGVTVLHVAERTEQDDSN